MTLLCAAGEIFFWFLTYNCHFHLIFSPGIPKFSHILGDFWGARVVPDSLTSENQGGARVVPDSISESDNLEYSNFHELKFSSFMIKAKGLAS